MSFVNPDKQTPVTSNRPGSCQILLEINIASKLVKDVTCPVCGCACDDLQLKLDHDRVTSVLPACHLAESWFVQQSNAAPPGALLKGQSVPFVDAINSAYRILNQSDQPLIYGLSRSSTPGQRAALALAERIGAIVDTTASICHGPSIMAVQQVGESTCTLGEVRNRADLVLFWGCEPTQTHPRHADRYSVFATGMFIPRGRGDRKIVVLGNRELTRHWELKSLVNGSERDTADLTIPISPKRDFEVISILRGLLRGESHFDPHDVFNQTGVGLDVLQRLIHQMKSCRCGVVFFGLGLTETRLKVGGEGSTVSDSGLGHLNVEHLLRLVAELNAHTRFHARRMRIQGDVSGADSVLCWQTGFPFSVSLSRGVPRYNPGEFSANELLERREVDACLLVGTETVSSFSDSALEYLQQIPTIALDYPASSAPFTPTVRMTTSVYGLHAPGTIYRMDEVPIPMHGYLNSPYPTDAEVLDLLREMLAEATNPDTHSQLP